MWKHEVDKGNNSSCNTKQKMSAHWNYVCQDLEHAVTHPHTLTKTHVYTMTHIYAMSQISRTYDAHYIDVYYDTYTQCGKCHDICISRLGYIHYDADTYNSGKWYDYVHTMTHRYTI